MNLQRIQLSDLTATDADSWRDLAAAASEPNPFIEAEFVLAAAANLDSAGIWLLVISCGPDWNLCLPMRRVRRWHHVPVAGTVAWDHSYGFLGTPLLRCGQELETVSVLVARLAGSQSGNFTGLETIASDGPFRAALTELLGDDRSSVHATTIREFERAALRRRDDGNYLQMKSKHRREFRRQRDRLAEQLGAPLETREVSGDAAALDRFLALEESGWKGHSGTAFASLYGHDAFFRGMCTEFAELGRLQLLELHADGVAVAMKCNLRAADAMFCFKIAFDEQWSRYSPGMLLELDNVERFHEDTSLSWMDSCASHNNEMINRLWPDRRPLETLVLTRGPRGLAARRTFEAAKIVRRAMKGD